MEISKVVQIALLGQVPPTLRFIFASYENAVPNFVAIFDDNATEDLLECARVVCTEVLASCPHNTKLVEKIEIDSRTPWKINGGENLLFLMGTANGTRHRHPRCPAVERYQPRLATAPTHPAQCDSRGRTWDSDLGEYVTDIVGNVVIETNGRSPLQLTCEATQGCSVNVAH